MLVINMLKVTIFEIVNQKLKVYIYCFFDNYTQAGICKYSDPYSYSIQIIFISVWKQINPFTKIISAIL